ncbi:MAG: hypothetical protein JSW68_01130 [Burkholderiales bacterium]|nr:MAG: hypothetical protein JSW68_01130 [Burkholderiales bacterium]
MAWKDLDTRDRWLMATAALQAAATIGTFLVALVGIWQVAPIITYQVQQQQAEAQRASQIETGETPTARFSSDAANWWAGQVDDYQRILDLTGPRAASGLAVSFEVIEHGTTTIAPGVTPDLLVLTATGPGGGIETVKVPVNESAMVPAQYLQCRINQGVFAGLDGAERARVETAVQRYIQRYMVPGVPPAHVRAEMSLRELHDEIALHQARRVEALQHLQGLRAMLDSLAGEKP